MDKHLLPALRKEIENSFGRKILSSRDCLQLVDDIYQKTGYNINGNTLRRFFGLVKTDYSASPSTLTILSKYCGFNSMDEIEKIAVNGTTDTSINSEEVLRYLISLFREAPALATGEDHFFLSLVQQTIVFLERNPSLIDRFQREIAKTPAGQYYYFEQSVNMDRLNGYYGDGLRHYLRGKNTNEARIFAHSLQVFRYWLTRNTEYMERHMVELSGFHVSQNYPSHILGRYIAAKLLYAAIKDESIDRILAEAKKYHTIIKISHGNSFPDFELIVCEALILTGHPEEASEYIPPNKNFFPGTTNSAFGLWEDILKIKRSYKEKVPRNNNQSVYSHNHHLTKRYTIIVKHSFGRPVNNKITSRTVQLGDLVRETGFVRFSQEKR